MDQARPEITPHSLMVDLHLALAFLTRLPMPPLEIPPPGALGRSMRLFPVVGLVVGALGGGAYAFANWLLPVPLAAVLAVAATIGLTGGLHEDGLADVADGFGGGKDREAKLAIMKDSRIGSYGALAIGLALLLRIGALTQLGAPGPVAGALIAAHALGRAAIPAVLLRLDPARRDGLGAAAGKPPAGTAGVAVTLAVTIAALGLAPAQALAALIGAGLAAAAVAWLAWRQIGGQTGDVLGAVEMAAETAALLAIVAAG